MGNEKFYAALVCDVLHHPELLEDERCRSHNRRIQNREVTEDLLNAWGTAHTVKDVCAALDAAGIPNAPVNSIREASEDPHFAQARNMFPRYIQPELGEVRVTNLPVRFPELGEVPIEAAPTFGGQTIEVLGELLRMEEQEIKQLKRDGIVTF